MEAGSLTKLIFTPSYYYHDSNTIVLNTLNGNISGLASTSMVLIKFRSVVENPYFHGLQNFYSSFTTNLSKYPCWDHRIGSHDVRKSKTWNITRVQRVLLGTLPRRYLT
jgi:hypothetical protein